MRIATPTLIVLALAAGLAAQEPNAPKPAAKPPAPARPTAVTPSVGTYYFYWYKHDSSHFKNADGSDALFQHFPRPESVDYADPAWHRSQLEHMMEAELDFFLPVYWGIPDKDEDPTGDFSDTGLAAIVEAMRSIIKAGGKPPRIGMFFDTSTLLHRVRGEDRAGTVDLRTPGGFDVFASTVLDFFSRVPEPLWFTLDGFPLVVLYSSFGAPHGRDLLDRVDDRFYARYRKRLFFIAEESWNVRAHARYRWGSALHGPTGDTVVKTLGPGYNDTPVPGRGTPVRDREETRFYRWSWNQALLANPTLVLIETWNEFHEGTGIAPCVEFGRTYVDITRRYVRRLKNRILPDIDHPVRLAHPDPLPRPDTGWWKVRPVAAVTLRGGDVDAPPPLIGDGLRLIPSEDGPHVTGRMGSRSVITAPAPGSGVTYLYFGIADEFAHRVAGSWEIALEIVDGGHGSVELQYDSWDGNAPVKGAYKSAPRFRRGTAVRLRTLTYTLADPRLSNRQNGGADFRLAVRGDALSVASVQVRPHEGRAPEGPTLDVR